MASARTLEAKALVRRAIRACRAIPVRHISEKLELNIKLASHYLVRVEHEHDPEELLQMGELLGAAHEMRLRGLAAR